MDCLGLQWKNYPPWNESSQFEAENGWNWISGFHKWKPYKKPTKVSLPEIQIIHISTEVQGIPPFANYERIPFYSLFGVCSKGVCWSNLTWRIIPFSKWLVTPIYKPFRPFGREVTPFRGLTNHGPWLLTTYKSWDDPPSRISCSLFPTEPTCQILQLEVDHRQLGKSQDNRCEIEISGWLEPRTQKHPTTRTGQFMK